MIVINNRPELSELFKNEELRDFLKEVLIELDNPYVLKRFLTDGVEKTYDDVIEQLSKSFKVIKKNPKKDGHLDGGYLEVERCIDGVRFKVGDKVRDLYAEEHGKESVLPIGRMYEDDRGLHVQLVVKPEPNFTVTWRDLGRIEHA